MRHHMLRRAVLGGDVLHGLHQEGRRRRGGVPQVETRVQTASIQRLKLKYDELLSRVVLNFKLRPYSKAVWNAKFAEYKTKYPEDHKAGGVLRTTTPTQIGARLTSG